MAGSLTHSIAAINRQGLFPVISEIKLRTLRDGDLLQGRSPVELARRMARCPIAGLSVVTEPETFGGSLDLLGEITAAVEAPVLHKDFIRTRAQIEESMKLGASVVLLIASLLEDKTLIDLQDFSHTLGLETVVEVHTERELQRVKNLGLSLDLLGINNRNIGVLETDDSDVTVTEELLRGRRKVYLPGKVFSAGKMPAPPVGLASSQPEVFRRTIKGEKPSDWPESMNVLILSESSLQGKDDVRRAFESGADAVLIGTAVMKAQDTEAFLWELIRAKAGDDLN